MELVYRNPFSGRGARLLKIYKDKLENNLKLKENKNKNKSQFFMVLYHPSINSMVA